MAILHKDIRPVVGDPDAGAHVLHYYTFDDIPSMNAGTDALLGAVVFTANDVGKVGRVGLVAPFTFYVLTEHTTPVWSALSAGSAGVYNTFVYQPGSIPSGNVYDNWTDLHAAVSAAVGEKTVVIDDSGGVASVDPGVWDIEGWVFLGVPGTFPGLLVSDGATFTGSSWVVDNVTLTADHTSGYIQSITGSTLDVTLRNNAAIEGSTNGGNFYFFRITGFGNPRLTLRLESGASLGTLNGNVCETAQQGVCYVEMYDGAGAIGANAFMNAAPGAGFLRYYYFGNSPWPFLSQVDYNDPVAFFPQNDMRYMNEVVKDLAFNATQTGTTELHIGSVYLTAGTEVKGASVALLGGSTVGETGNLRMRRFTGGTITGGDYTTIGTLAQANPLGGQFSITDTDFYDFYLFAGGPAETAIIKGLRLAIIPSVENGV